MATRRSTGRKAPPAVSHHKAPIIIAVLLAAVTTAMGWPGMLALPIGVVIARFASRTSERSLKDAWGEPAPVNPKQDKGVRFVRAWARPRKTWLPLGPTWLAAFGCALLSAVFVRTGIWWQVAHVVSLTMTLMSWGHARRMGTPDIPYMDWRGRFGDGKIVKPAIITCVAVAWALIVALLLSIPVLPIAGAISLAAGLWLYLPRRREFQAEARDSRMARDLVVGWLEQTTKPPVRRPTTASKARRPAEGTLTAHLFVPDGAGPWTDGKVAKLLSPYAEGDRYRVTFAPVDGDGRNIRVLLIPTSFPGTERLSPAQMRIWLQWDLLETSSLWNAPAGVVDKVESVGTETWAFTIKGGQEPRIIQRDWLQGSSDDFGAHLPGVTIIGDASGKFYWALGAGAENFDDGRAMAWRESHGSGVTTSHSLEDYLGLLERAKNDGTMFEQALAKAKLPPPEFTYDTERLLDGGTWQMTVMRGAIVRGAWSMLDYMGVDMRAAIADATVADIMPVRSGGGRWSRRFILWCRSQNAPERIGRLAADDEANRTLATVLVSRAFREAVGAPALVYDARLATRPCKPPVWRLAVDLPGGTTVAEVLKRDAKLAASLGAESLMWEWRGHGNAVLWCGAKPDLDPAHVKEGWQRVSDYRQVTRLTLDRAWESAKVVSVDGRTPRATSIDPVGSTGLVMRATFELPPGISTADMEAGLKTFQSSAGYGYARLEPTGKADEAALVLATGDPIPRMATAKWDEMSCPPDTVLPFGTLDTGETLAHDLSLSPHLLVTGTTGFGKSSACLSLVSSAVLKGWGVVVADPEKGANDFAAFRRVTRGFAVTLADTAAALQWADAEMSWRVELLKEHGAGNIADLPRSVRPQRLMVFVDEFNSLLSSDGKPAANPSNDPDIANANAELIERNRLRSLAGGCVTRIAAKGRSAGIMLLLAAQALTASELDLLPSAGTLKRNVARLFLGSGNPAGNVSDVRIKDANRLIRMQGDMPKGRGLYEPTGGMLSIVQTWWSGDDIERRLEGVPDVEAVDWSKWLPGRIAAVGVVDDEVVEVTDFGGDWVL